MTGVRPSRALAALAVAVFSAVLMLAASGPVEAAFPGKNGKIAFESVFDTWVKNPSLSSPETKLLDGAFDVAYSPDGSRIAFVRESPGPEIFVGRADGKGTPRKLTSNTVVDDNPAWSPDGTQIVYESGIHIWTMNADGSAKRPLTTTELPGDDPKFDPTGPSFSPAWSVPLPSAPDGKLAFAHGGRLWTMLADGSDKQELNYTCPTENGGICDNAIGPPTFSPNGARIAAHYFGDVFTVPSGGGTSTLLLQGPESGQPLAEQFATWSPNGASIAFQATPRTGGQSAIYVAPAGGTTDRPTRITSNDGDIEPEWMLSRPKCATTNGTFNSALVGTAGNDTINGTAGDDVICGLGSNDRINGGGGDDVILGDDGNDILISAAGRDTLNGGTGTDAAYFSGSPQAVQANLVTGFARRVGTSPLSGVALVEIENLTGTGANDRLTGSSVANVLVGGAGADAIVGLGGADTLNSRDGVNGNDALNGGAGTDRCVTDARERSVLNCP